MTKITIDDVDYETDDFTKEQKEIYQDMLNARSEIMRLEYMHLVLTNRVSTLAGILPNPPKKEAEEASDG